MKLAEFSNLVPFRFLVKSKHKEQLILALEEAKVCTRSFFYPMHKQPRLQEYRAHSCVHSERLYEEGICLPIHSHLEREDVDYICDTILNFEKSIS